MYKLLLIKRTIEDILISPFILVGRLIALIKPLKKTYRIYFFFPFYHTGGAELFNMQLVNAVGGADCIIYFTRKSGNDRFYEDFESSGCVIRDISWFTDNKLIYFMNLVYRGIISGYINKQKKKPIIFNGQCNFGYKLSPWVNKKIPQLEFIHTFCSMSYIRTPFIPYYTYTLSSSTKTISDHQAFYRKQNVPETYFNNFKYILYGIDLPSQKINLSKQNDVKVLFVGRGSPEKRVHLVALMAKEVHKSNAGIRFEFMGDVREAIPNDLHPYCYFWDNQTDKEKIDSIYKSADVLIITSLFEGFPLVVMEAMARGLAIISTNVGDIPIHIKDGENGFIIRETFNENIIIQKGVEFIIRLNINKELLNNISKNNVDYAVKHFGIKTFNQQYKSLFASLKQQAN